IVDDKLYAVEEGPRRQRNGKASTGREPSRSLQVSALKLVQKITALRPELDLYILIEKEREDEVVDTLFAEAVDGYFYREERDYRGMYRILNAQIAERARTPFYDALCAYVLAAKDAWHTPGHSSGDSLRASPWVNDFHDFMGEHVFDADLSVSAKALDSLMEPTGVIAEAQQMAAKAFGEHPDAQLLVLTSCTYDGLRYDLKPVIDAAHASGIKVLIDEAWFSHARFHPDLRPTALEAGADYVTQSMHKTLSAFSQAAM